MKAEFGLIQRWQTSIRMIEHLRAGKSPQPISHVDHSKPLIPAYYFKLIKAEVGGGGYFKKACAMAKSMQTCFGWFCVSAHIYLRECTKIWGTHKDLFHKGNRFGGSSKHVKLIKFHEGNSNRSSQVFPAQITRQISTTQWKVTVLEQPQVWNKAHTCAVSTSISSIWKF